MPWEVRSLDVWADSDGGLFINHAARLAYLSYRIGPDVDPRALLVAMQEAGYVNMRARLREDIESGLLHGTNYVPVYFEDSGEGWEMMGVGNAERAVYEVHVHTATHDEWLSDFEEQEQFDDRHHAEVLAERLTTAGVVTIGGQEVAIDDVEVNEVTTPTDWPELSIVWVSTPFQSQLANELFRVMGEEAYRAYAGLD